MADEVSGGQPSFPSPYYSQDEVKLVSEQTIKCWNCETEFTWDPTKRKKTIFASDFGDKPTSQLKKTHTYAVPCPECNERNEVKV